MPTGQGTAVRGGRQECHYGLEGIAVQVGFPLEFARQPSVVCSDHHQIPLPQQRLGWAFPSNPGLVRLSLSGPLPAASEVGPSLLQSFVVGQAHCEPCSLGNFYLKSGMHFFLEFMSCKRRASSVAQKKHRMLTLLCEASPRTTRNPKSPHLQHNCFKDLLPHSLPLHFTPPLDSSTNIYPTLRSCFFLLKITGMMRGTVWMQERSNPFRKVSPFCDLL